jgi:hypothetical protein
VLLAQARADEVAQGLDRLVRDAIEGACPLTPAGDDPTDRKAVEMLGDARHRDARQRGELPDRDLADVVERADNPQTGRIAQQRELPRGQLEELVGNGRNPPSLACLLLFVN